MQKLLENLNKIQITPDFIKAVPETPGVYLYFNQDKVIYIGKAINLKRRVGSYFDLDLDTKTRRMISEAKFISFIKVASELESLLLEARLIKKYQPHYNIIAKDDKHPLYIRITKEECPRILTARKIDESQKNIAFFGPFPSSRNVYSVLRMLRHIFPYSDHKTGKRACIYSHIGLCNPCPSEIGKIKDKKEKDSQIQKYRKNIRNIKSILDGKIDKVIKELDREMENFSKNESFESAAIIRNQIESLKYITRPQMLTDFYLENPNLYEDNKRKELFNFKKLLKQGGINTPSLKRMECFDIAHLAGTEKTASMVTFVDGEAYKRYYRHFKIKKVKGNNDYASMEEVAKRRMSHFEDWGKPNIIIVDGGIGQIKAFKKAISDIPIVGIAKNPDRLITEGKKIKLEGSSLNIVARMRDEAHRFARRYHHKLVSRTLTGK